MYRRYLGWTLLGLVIPVSVAVLAWLIPDLLAPGRAVWLTLGLGFLLLALGVAVTWRYYRTFQDYVRSVVLLFLVALLPLMASLLLLNRAVPLNVRTEERVLLERFERRGGEGSVLFLWDGEQLEAHRLSLRAPAAAAVPGDTVALHIVRGLLTFEYLAHADLIR